MSNKLEVLCQRMYEITNPKCKQCMVPLSCCHEMYCHLAATEIQAAGIQITTTGHPTLPYMGPTGCVVPPHLRPLCTVHVCSINSLGCDPKDHKFTKEYFKLRDKIEHEVYKQRTKVMLCP